MSSGTDRLHLKFIYYFVFEFVYCIDNVALTQNLKAHLGFLKTHHLKKYRRIFEWWGLGP